MLTSERAQFLVENLDLPTATGVADARWEAFQLAHLNDTSTFRIEVKSRQIAWSWLSAAHALADAILDAQSSLFVSYNQEEAKEKIRYARMCREALPTPLQPQLVRDNDLQLEFPNGARLISLPARPPRGKARMNVFLDEFAHTPHDRTIYTAALPVISKGGMLRIGSSPLGGSGVFWELFTQTLRPYPGYRRRRTPWWLVQAFCTDVRTAYSAAPGLDTAERVARFGNERIRVIYDNMLLEDFQQEYEAAFVDETTAWISWDELRAVQDAALHCDLVSCKDNAIDRALAAITVLRTAIDAGQIERVLGGGLDIGRTRNTTELYLLGVSTTNTYPLRLALSLDNCAFDAQYAVVERALQTLPLTKLLIDQTGIGRNLAENAMRDFPTKAEGLDFTNASKALWAGDAKMLVQQRRTPLPVDRDLAYQIHSIKKTVTAAKNLVFDTDRNEKHHADKFWAWALALQAAKQPHARPFTPATTAPRAPRVGYKAD